MDGFTARGALLTGLDLIRRRPWLILLWVGLFLAADIVFAAASQAFQAWRVSDMATGRSSYSFLGRSLVYTTGMMVVSMVVQAVLWTSAFRAFLRSNGSGRAPFGSEELVVTVSWVIVQLIMALGSGALTVLITERAIRVGGPIVVGPMLRAPSDVLGAIGLYWAAVAGAWAFAGGEIALLRCWTMMRGRFWKVTGLVAGLAVIAYVLRAAIRAWAGIVNHHAPLPAITLQTLTETPVIVVVLAGVAVTVLQMVFVGGIVASAYRAGAARAQAASFSAGSAAAPS